MNPTLTQRREIVERFKATESIGGEISNEKA